MAAGSSVNHLGKTLSRKWCLHCQEKLDFHKFIQTIVWEHKLLQLFKKLELRCEEFAN